MPASSQRQLFDPHPGPWEADHESTRRVATVVFASGPPQPLDYLVPLPLVDAVSAGQRLRVPLGRGNRSVTGYCVAVESRPDDGRRLKAVIEAYDLRPLLSPAMLRLTRWMSEYYLCGWGQVLESVVPAGVRSRAGTREALLLSLAPGVLGQLTTLDLPAKQMAVLHALAGPTAPMVPRALAAAAQCTQAPIAALRRKGLVVAHTERIATVAPPPAVADLEDHLELNLDQQAALDAVLAALRDRRHETLLLHGVTGSGKTEVYIHAIREVLTYGRQAIVLVPEISLTPQTIARFQARFGEVAVLHSHLSDAERHAHWQQIASGRVQVVVGARSAIFAPAPHLGLIVLDEEHESTFKQESAPRYHARDVALYRAQTEGVPLILGSATPSLESWHAAETGDYRLLSLPRRVLGRVLPDVATIDLRAEFRDRRLRGAISRPLALAIEAALRDGGQVILLLNRRGFATHVQCPGCGAALRCPHCDLALTHHRQAETLLCHHCDYRTPPPLTCPACNSPGIRYGGLGTQRLEAEVQARFPGHRCLRMDTDTMQRPGSHARALEAFRTGEVQILLGTQMIAKGLDFPNVTLVGVVNADTALHLPDFRAAERTFHLLAQVAGRTGRGSLGGRVYIQTFDPDHVALRAVVRHDYEGFAAAEMALRQEAGYPPSQRLVRLVVRGPVEDTVRAWAVQLVERIVAAAETDELPLRVLGPAPAPFARLKNKYRYQVHVHGPLEVPTSSLLYDTLSPLEPPENVEWIIDVDPQSML